MLYYDNYGIRRIQHNTVDISGERNTIAVLLEKEFKP
jgi:hypothetical protein